MVQELSRQRRIAQGSGCSPDMLQHLLVQHKQMTKAMQGARPAARPPHHHPPPPPPITSIR